MILPKFFDRLKGEKRWVAWTKVPIERLGRNPLKAKTPLDIRDHGGQTGARANDPATWGTLDEVAAFVDAHTNTGIGIQLGGGLAGVDLDHVRDKETGALTPSAQQIVDALGTYTEASPSGTGLHCLMYADPAFAPERKRGPLPEQGTEIEVYTVGRYFTVTGQPIRNGEQPAADRTQALKSVTARYLPKPQTQPVSTPPQPVTVPASLEDAEVLDKMFGSVKGSALRALYDGDTSAYAYDHSAADLAFCGALAYWTNGDAAQMDRLFRGSALMRDKWDEIHDPAGMRTYGRMTIDKALADFTPYAPPTRGTDTLGKIGSCDAVLPLGDADVPWPEAVPPPDDGDFPFDSEAEQLEHIKAAIQEVTVAESLQNAESFWNGITKGAHVRIPTGLPELDRLIGGGLYPGVMALGARTGTGKTTLVLQIADSLAAGGRPVLYVALEMGKDELAAKSIARIHNAQTGESVSFARILEGWYGDEIRPAADEYFSWAEKYMHVLDATAGTTANGVVRMAEAVATEVGTAPVVVVDYLQLLRPEDSRLTDKQAADANVLSLKKLSKQLNTPVIAVTSFNRASYSDTVKQGNSSRPRTEDEWYDVLESAHKESGGIEYTCDMLLGLRVVDYHRAPDPLAPATDTRLYLVKNRRGLAHRSIDLVFRGDKGAFHVSDSPFTQMSPLDEEAATEREAAALAGLRARKNAGLR